MGRLMNESEIKQKLIEFFTDNFLFGEEFQLGDEDSLLENGIMDSAGVLTLVLFLEEEFECTIEDDEVTPEHLDSLQNLVQFITSKAS